MDFNDQSKIHSLPGGVYPTGNSIWVLFVGGEVELELHRARAAEVAAQLQGRSGPFTLLLEAAHSLERFPAPCVRAWLEWLAHLPPGQVAKVAVLARNLAVSNPWGQALLSKEQKPACPVRLFAKAEEARRWLASGD